MVLIATVMVSAVEVHIIHSVAELLPFLDSYVYLLSDYFIWNIRERHRHDPELFERNAARMGSSFEELLEEFEVMANTGILSDRQQQRLEDQFAQGQWLALIHGHGGTLAGMARLLKRGSNAELHSVYVDPGFRGKGLGSLLLDELVAVARANSIDAICLDTMPFMEAAVELYRSKGFVEVDYIDFPQYTPERAKEIGVIFMQMQL